MFYFCAFQPCLPIATTSGAIIPPNAKVLYWRNDGTFDLIEENSIFLYFFPFSCSHVYTWNLEQKFHFLTCSCRFLHPNWFSQLDTMQWLELLSMDFVRSYFGKMQLWQVEHKKVPTVWQKMICVRNCFDLLLPE